MARTRKSQELEAPAGAERPAIDEAMIEQLVGERTTDANRLLSDANPVPIDHS